jgi:hypothetical protein
MVRNRSLPALLRFLADHPLLNYLGTMLYGAIRYLEVGARCLILTMTTIPALSLRTRPFLRCLAVNTERQQTVLILCDKNSHKVILNAKRFPLASIAREILGIELFGA